MNPKYEGRGSDEIRGLSARCDFMTFVDFFPVCRGRPRRGGRPIGHRGQESACRPDPLSDRRVAPGSEPSRQVHSRSRVLPPGRPRRCWASSDASPSRKDGSRTTSGPMTCISTRSRLTDRLLHQESWQRRLPTWSRSSSRSRSRVRIAGMRLRTPPLYRRLEIGVPTWWIRTERGLVSTGF